MQPLNIISVHLIPAYKLFQEINLFVEKLNELGRYGVKEGQSDRKPHFSLREERGESNVTN